MDKNTIRKGTLVSTISCGVYAFWDLIFLIAYYSGDGDSSFFDAAAIILYIISAFAFLICSVVVIAFVTCQPPRQKNQFVIILTALILSMLFLTVSIATSILLFVIVGFVLAILTLICMIAAHFLVGNYLNTTAAMLL